MSMLCFVVMYRCETWTFSESDENQLRMFERRIFRRIYGIAKEEDSWSIGKNKEFNALIEGKDIVMFTKAQRISWLGHAERMEDTRMVKSV